MPCCLSLRLIWMYGSPIFMNGLLSALRAITQPSLYLKDANR